MSSSSRSPALGARRRGRPPKPPNENDIPHIGIAGQLTSAQVSVLRDAVLQLPDVANLPAMRRICLLRQLTSITSFAVVTANVVVRKVKNGHFSSTKRGRRPALEKSTVIFDCARAWKIATGREIDIWRPSETRPEALPCAIARVVLQVALGLKRPYSGSS